MTRHFQESQTVIILFELLHVQKHHPGLVVKLLYYQHHLENAFFGDENKLVKMHSIGLLFDILFPIPVAHFHFVLSLGAVIIS